MDPTEELLDIIQRLDNDLALCRALLAQVKPTFSLRSYEHDGAVVPKDWFMARDESLQE